MRTFGSHYSELSTSTHITRFHPWLTFAVKSILVTLLIVLIVREVVLHPSRDAVAAAFQKQASDPSAWLFLGIGFLLMPVNWGLEVLKWHRLTRVFATTSWSASVEAVLYGLTAGIITPSRVGEYAGRVIALPPKARGMGIYAQFVNSCAQNFIHLFFGSILGFYFLQTAAHWPEAINAAFISVGLCICLLLLFILYRPNALLRLAHRWLPENLRFFGYSLPLRFDLASFDRKDSFFILSVSAIRYLIFTIQYALLLAFFGVDLPLPILFSGIGLIFLIQSGLPLPPFWAMLARGEIALFVWSPFTDQSLSILAATFSLWLVNLLLPAFVGSMIFVRKKI